VQINAIPTINDARSSDFHQKTVVVIDVLRATSCIVTAMAKGAAGVMPVETVQEAINLHKDDTVLCGERHCKKVAGFHYGNSPTELNQHDLTQKKLILTTTNGTRVIQKCRKGWHILCASFLNAKNCAEAILSLGRDTIIVSAGTYDRFSLEDSLCAGLVIAEVLAAGRATRTFQLNDFAKAMHAAYLHLQTELEQTLLNCENGRKLRKLGHEEDVRFCANVNTFDIVPIVKNQMIVCFQANSHA